MYLCYSTLVGEDDDDDGWKLVSFNESLIHSLGHRCVYQSVDQVVIASATVVVSWTCIGGRH